MPAVVDVVVRTKDRPAFLRRALSSIAGQELDDWRAVVVNDGGDPALVEDEIAAAGLQDRVTVIHHAESRGRWPSANAGIAACDAPFVVLHDDDDTWHPEFLRRCVAHLEQDPEAVGVVSRIEIVWESFDGESFSENGRELFQGHLSAPLLADAMLFNRFVPIGFVYRRELHEMIGPYREDLAVVGDWEFNLRVLSRWSLSYVAEQPLAYWHQRPAATGVDANSVISESARHRHDDRWVRDARLREHVQREGDGDLLYLTKFVDQRFLDLEHYVGTRVSEILGGLDEIEARAAARHEESLRATWEASSLTRAKVWWRRRTGRA